MFKKLFLLLLFSFYTCNVNLSASENAPLEVPPSFIKAYLKTAFFIVFVSGIITIMKKIHALLNPVNDGSYTSLETKLMTSNNQIFYGNIIEPIQRLIELLKVIPAAEPCNGGFCNRFMSLFCFRSNVHSIDPELRKLLQNGYILYGPSGHGKNFVIQEMKNILAKSFDVANQSIPFMFVNGDFNTKYVGGAAHNWKNTIDDLRKCIQKTPKKIGFLVIDECEKLFAKRTESRSTENPLTHILSTIEGFNIDETCKIIIIGLTNLIEYIDFALISRFQTIYFVQPEDSLKKIVKEKLNSMKIDIPNLIQFVEQGGLVTKQLKMESNLFTSYASAPLAPRDVDWITREIFAVWAVSQERKDCKTQAEMVKAFSQCSSDEKSGYFDKAFTIDWNETPPVLYSNSLKLSFN